MRKIVDSTLLMIVATAMVVISTPIAVNGATTTYYLSNTATSGSCASPGPCRQLSATTGPADTTTQQSVSKGSGGVDMQIRPDTLSSSSGTPSTSTPSGTGWVYDTDLAGKGIQSGTWTFDITVSASNAMDTGFLYITAWNCTTDHFTACAFLFNIWDATTNVLGATTPTRRAYSASEPFFGMVHYIAIEYWLHVTAHNKATTVTEKTNDASSDVVLPTPFVNVISFVGSTSSSSIINGTGSNSNNGILTVTYTSASGDFIGVSIVHSNRPQGGTNPVCTILSLSDSGGSTYSKLASVTTPSGMVAELWGTTGTGSLASISLTVIANTNCYLAGTWYVLASASEYASAIDTLGQTNTNSGISTDTGSGVTADCKSTLFETSPGDWWVSGFSVLNPSTVPVAGSGSTVRTDINGNQVAWDEIADSQGSTSNLNSFLDTSVIGHQTGSAIGWGCASVELRTV